jgi:hypothetical protein
MVDIFGSPDHLTETGVATSTTAPIKVAPIKSIFRIVVLLNKDTRHFGPALILNLYKIAHSVDVNLLAGPPGYAPDPISARSAASKEKAA